MKKIYKLALLVLLLLPFKVYAAGGFSLSTSSVSMYPGETRTFNINSDNSVGRLNISTSNGGVAATNTGSIFIKYPGSSETITITGHSVGTATISVVASENYATMDEELLTGQTRTVTVNVIERPVAPQPAPQQPTNPQPTQTYTPSNLSSNNTLKDIEIEGYKLEKIDNNNYKLTVPNNITNIKINATAEDSKASISGIGNKEVLVGENIFEITITAENSAQNKIYIKVTRKDGYYLDDLDTIVNDKKIKDADIIINDETEISKEQLNKIKKSKKQVRLNYYDKDKKLLYIWYINGKEIKETNKFSTFIAFTAQNLKEIYKLSNYADGIYIKFQHEGVLPKGTRLKIYVGDKYEDKDIVNLYHHNKTEKQLELVKEKIVVKDKYIEFNIEHCSDYFITMSTINNNDNNSSPSIIFILLIIALTIIISLIIFIFVKIKPIKNNSLNKHINESKTEILEDDTII